jgi:hypothetical protein
VEVGKGKGFLKIVHEYKHEFTFVIARVAEENAERAVHEDEG